MSERTIGLDVSFWQDYDGTPQQIDFDKAKSNGAHYVFIRTSQDLTTDPDFEYNYRESKKAGLLRGAYHYYDYRKPAAPQAEHFAGLLLDDRPDLPPVLDVEKHRNWPLPPRRNMLLGIEQFIETFVSLYGSKPIFYTNPGMNKYYFKPVPDWLLECDLWIAHYLRNPLEREPTYAPWSKWTFWQYTDRGNGKAFGMESKQVDVNYFNGSLEDLKAYAGQQEVDEPDGPAPELTLEQKVEILWKAFPNLHPD